MKLTGKYEKISPLSSLYVVLGLLCAAVPVRMYQLLDVVESDTGFYKTENWSVYLMYALGVAAVIVPYVLTFLSKNVPASKSPFRKNKFLAVSSIAFAVGIVLDVVSAVSSFLINARSFGRVGMSAFGTLDQGQIPLLLEAVFGVFAAIYLFVFGISYIDGRTTYSQYKFLAITPLFWAMSRIVLRFMRKIAYVNVSDLMLEIFILAFMMLFLLSFARICSGLSNAKAMRSLFASGFVSLFFAVTANLPRLIVLCTGNFGALPDEYPFSLCDLAFAVFVFAYVINAINCAKENDSAELLDEAPEEKGSMETDDNFLSE